MISHCLINEVKKLSQGIIESRAFRGWSTAHVVVKKKDGALRLSFDFQNVNNIAIRNVYLNSRIDSFLSKHTVFEKLTSTQVMIRQHQVRNIPIFWSESRIVSVQADTFLTDENTICTFQRFIDFLFGQKFCPVDDPKLSLTSVNDFY